MLALKRILRKQRKALRHLEYEIIEGLEVQDMTLKARNLECYIFSRKLEDKVEEIFQKAGQKVIQSRR